MPKKKKRFVLPGNNRKTATPPPSTKPAPIQLTAENSPLWIAKFLEEIRNELRVLNGHFAKALENVGTE